MININKQFAKVKLQLAHCEGECERAFRNIQRMSRAILALIVLLAFSIGLFAGWMLKGVMT